MVGEWATAFLVAVESSYQSRLDSSACVANASSFRDISRCMVCCAVVISCIALLRASMCCNVFDGNSLHASHLYAERASKLGYCSVTHFT